MIKMFRHIVALAVLTFTVLILAGCGGSVNTELILNEDMSGSRVMTVTVDQAYFNRNFKGTPEQFYQLITDSSPAEISWSKNDPDDMVYIGTIPFQSIEDYTSKIKAILGNDADVYVSTMPDVNDGEIIFKENFTSEQLLEPVKNAILLSEYVDAQATEQDEITDQVSLTWNGKTYSGTDRIFFGDDTRIEVDSIEILTTFREDDTFDRTIVLNIPENIMRQRGEEIKDHFAALIPADALWTEWDSSSLGETAAITFVGLSPEKLESYTNRILGSDGKGTVSFHEIANKSNDFDFSKNLTETLNLEAFSSDGNADIPVRYYLKAVQGVKLCIDGMDITPLMYSSTSLGDSELKGYYIESEKSGTENQYVITKKHCFYPLSAEVTTKVENDRHYAVTSVFTFDAVPNDEERSSVISAISERIEKTSKDAAEASATVKDSTDQDKYVLMIEIEGKISDLRSYFIAIYKASCSINCEENDSLLGIMSPLSFYSFQDYSQFLLRDGENVFSMQQKADLGPDGKPDKSSLPAGAKSEGSSAVFAVDSDYAFSPEITFTGGRLNKKALLTVLGFILTFIIILFCAIKSRFFKTVRAEAAINSGKTDKTNDLKSAGPSEATEGKTDSTDTTKKDKPEKEQEKETKKETEKETGKDQEQDSETDTKDTPTGKAEDKEVSAKAENIKASAKTKNKNHK